MAANSPQKDTKLQQSPAQADAAARADEPLDDVPPATANAPAVREAWLQRIRTLRDSGNIVDARSSLHAFIRRYPTYPLPEDLRALARSTNGP